MTRRQALMGAKFAVAGVLMAGGALAAAAQASADPEEPLPIDPAVTELGPGQAAVVPVDPATINTDPALPPAGQAPVVPEVQAPPQSTGIMGSLGALWTAARTGDPDALNPTAGQAIGAPEGAGPAPMLPPGYVSMTAPESTNTTPVEEVQGPALPEGYYSLDGPPPPGYDDPAMAPLGPVLPTP